MGLTLDSGRDFQTSGSDQGRRGREDTAAGGPALCPGAALGGAVWPPASPGHAHPALRGEHRAPEGPADVHLPLYSGGTCDQEALPWLQNL